MDRIHPSWIDDLLARQSPAVARLVLEALPATTTARLAVAPVSSCGDLPDWVRPLLVRMVLGQLAPMPAGEATSAQAPAQLALLRSERLHDVLTRLGLLALALLVRKAAGPDIVEQVTRALPGPLRRRFQVALSLEIPALPHPPQSLPLTGGADTERRLVALACGLLAPRLTRRLRRQVAQRLPRELGLPLWQATVAPRSTPGESLQLLSLADRLALEDGT